MVGVRRARISSVSHSIYRPPSFDVTAPSPGPGVPAIVSPPGPRADVPAPSQSYNDKYVILYDAGGVDFITATKEFTALLGDLEDTGLHTEVRAGFNQSLLIFVKAPKELLGNTVYKSRVKDWLYGIIPTHPGGSKNTIVRGAYEAEDLLSLHHLVNWPKELGGAGITPGLGNWENIKAEFPLHNEEANYALLRRLSRRAVLTRHDLDSIRDLFGSKVAFYFAFIQTYLIFLIFPAIIGLAAWTWLPKYSLVYAITICLWCSFFLEYWKVRETDLGLRWGVKGVNTVEVSRPQFHYERILVDENGRTTYFFPKRKQIARKMLQIPFVFVAAIALGALIVFVCAVEILISETYAGPYKFYLEYLPTGVLAVSLPCISSSLEGVAEWMTEFENHRTADQHEMALTQKIFVLNIITNYLPILLIAFVYIPFGDDIVPWIEVFIQKTLDTVGIPFEHEPFVSDPNKLRNEVIALTVTGQLLGIFEENVLPFLRNRLRAWYRNYRHANGKGTMFLSVARDDPEEADFLSRCRNEATLPKYNVQEDIAEIVLQFGYLALFSPVWPLIPVGFLLNNWVELRSDFAKICFEHQRPAPIRADGIGPWISSLEFLTWFGSITTAAIVHLFGTIGDNDGGGGGGGLEKTSRWWTLPLTIFLSEHALLAFRSLIRYVLRQIGSDEIRREKGQRYANRVKHLQEIEANKRAGLSLSVAERERRKSVLVMGRESFWTKQVQDGVSAGIGIGLIKRVKQAEAGKVQSKFD